MKYDLRFKPRSIKDLKKLPAQQQRRVLRGIEGLPGGLTGNVKKLTDFTPEYRLRVGDFRILFEIEGPSIIV